MPLCEGEGCEYRAGTPARYAVVLGRIGDHANELAACVATLPGELHEFSNSVAQLTLLGCANDFDSAARRHFKQPFVTESTQRS